MNCVPCLGLFLDRNCFPEVFSELTALLLLSEQDAGLDALSSIISRQKQMGQEIGNELDEQNGKDVSDIDQICH